MLMGSALLKRSRTKTTRLPVLVAIVGGSGSGKSYVADELARRLGSKALRLSLDDFYIDRSHLSQKQRQRINYDHPRAIDWRVFESALTALLRHEPTEVPRYDFATHSRKPRGSVMKPKPFVLVDGLWLLRRPALRGLFSLKLFLGCPAKQRLERRLKRDEAVRGRSARSVREQFARAVEPMHCRFVEPQRRWADVVLPPSRTGAELDEIARAILDLHEPTASAPG